MKPLVALGGLSAFRLGAGAMFGAVQLGVVDVEAERGDSSPPGQGARGSTVESTAAGEELEGVDEADSSPHDLAQCARRAEGVSEAKLNPDDADLLAERWPAAWYEPPHHEERLFRNGTVVTAFETSASDDERRAMAGCL